MEFYQNNLDSSKEKVYLALEAEDGERAISILQEASIPVNGGYRTPLEIIAHENVEEMNIEDEDVKQEVIQQASDALNENINDSWVDIVNNIDILDQYLSGDSDNEEEENDA